MRYFCFGFCFCLFMNANSTRNRSRVLIAIVERKSAFNQPSNKRTTWFRTNAIENEINFPNNMVFGEGKCYTCVLLFVFITRHIVGAGCPQNLYYRCITKYLCYWIMVDKGMYLSIN